MGLDHVQLAMPPGAAAEEAALAFYCDGLGLQPVPKPPELRGRGGVWFEGTCLRLHLGVEDQFAPARKAHPALMVDDLDGLIARLASTQHQLVVPTEQAGARHAYVDDPFGNRVELIETTGPTPPMFATIAEHAIYPMTLIDDEGVIRWVGASIERFFGYPPEALIGRRFDYLLAPESLPMALEAFANISDAYEPTAWGGVGVPLDLMRIDGSRVACEVAAITTQRTGLPWFVVVVRQAGYERALDRTLAAMAGGAGLEEMLAHIVTAVEHMVPGTSVAIGDGWTGERFSVTAGDATNLLVSQPGSPWAKALATGTDRWVEDFGCLPRPLAALARAEGYAGCWVHPVTPALGAQPTAAIIIWRRIPSPPTSFIWSTVRRAGQLLSLTLQWDRSQSSLAFAATHDPLTGLANRQAFRDRLHTVAERGPNGNGATRAAVLYIDLDRFKPVNDQLGHLIGDRVLTVVAKRMMTVLRPGDMVARMGGDEFAVLCERLSSRIDAERVTDRVLAAIRNPIAALAQDDIFLDASVGLVDVWDGESVDAVLARADEAMRSAKKDGRGCWRWHSSP